MGAEQERKREREREKWWVSADKQQWCRITFAGGCGAMAGEKEVIRERERER